MEKERKNKMMNILLWAGLGALILFVVITAIVLNFKNKEKDELNQKNDIVKPSQSIIRVID